MFGHMCFAFYRSENVTYKLAKNEMYFLYKFSSEAAEVSQMPLPCSLERTWGETEFCHIEYNADRESTLRKSLMEPRQNVV